MNSPFDDDPELAALLDEASNEDDPGLELPQYPGASRASKDYAHDLLCRLNREDEYDLNDMTQREISELIDECKSELGWD